MAVPSIKGTLFAGVVEDVDRALGDGSLTRELLESRLEAADLALVDSKINATTWYEIPAYQRICGVLAEISGEDEVSFWFGRGRRAAVRLLEMGIYQQLDYLGRMTTKKMEDPEARVAAFGRDMKLLMTLQAAMLNFSEWTCAPDPESPMRYQVEIRGTAGISDGLFIATAGLFTELAERTRNGAGWRTERRSDDLVVVRMTYDL